MLVGGSVLMAASQEVSVCGWCLNTVEYMYGCMCVCVCVNVCISIQRFCKWVGCLLSCGYSVLRFWISV